jgi:HSP20 family molecular chaperone IbpA
MSLRVVQFPMIPIIKEEKNVGSPCSAASRNSSSNSSSRASQSPSSTSSPSSSRAADIAFAHAANNSNATSRITKRHRNLVWDCFDDGDMVSLSKHKKANTSEPVLSPVASTSPQSTLLLKVDVVEVENSFEVHADLPGIDMKEVDVEIDESGQQLIISVKRWHVHDKQSNRTHDIERSFGQLVRSVPIPEGALADTADARFANGVLTVQFAKRPEASGGTGTTKKLQIRAGSADEAAAAVTNTVSGDTSAAEE